MKTYNRKGTADAGRWMGHDSTDPDATTVADLEAYGVKVVDTNFPADHEFHGAIFVHVPYQENEDQYMELILNLGHWFVRNEHTIDVMEDEAFRAMYNA